MVRRLIPVLALASMSALAGSARPLGAQGKAEDLVIASTTDVHGWMRGWDYFADAAEPSRGLSRAATVVDSLRAAHPGRVILLDAGDLLQGTPLTYAAARIDTAAPHPVIAAMNAMRYDAAVVGNHEFNYGVPFLTRTVAQAAFPFLAANARRPDGSRAWPAFVIVERAGARIGIVGATNPGSMVWDRDNLASRIVVGDIVSELRVAVDSARAAGAQVIVVVGHAGLDGASSYDTVTTKLASENPMARVAREVPGIDAIVMGHSHREIADTVINGVLLTQPRNWATSVSVVHLELVPRGATWSVGSKRASLVRAAGHAEQAGVVAVVERGHQAARRYALTVLGSTDLAWRADSARVTDTPLLDFVLESMQRASGADLASAAAFSLDVKIPAGKVTVAQLAQLYPYDNTLRALRISGAQLREYLEQSARYFRVRGSGDSARVDAEPSIPGYNFEIVAGVDYAIDLTRPAGRRITGLSRNGRPVADADSFSIALSNYRAGGAGGYAMLNGSPVAHDKGLEIRQLLIDEVSRRGTLRQADYFHQNWRLVPAALAAKAYASMRAERDFEATTPAAGAKPAASPTPSPQATPASRVAPNTPVAHGTPAALPSSRPGTLRIISVNDFHGALEARPAGNLGLRGGAAQLATVIRRAEAECSGECVSILLDGGDEFQGTAASNLAFGRPVVKLFDALGVAASALGNHEFDWGSDSLRSLMRGARYAILGANVRHADGSAVDWIRQDTIVERGGLKIGIVGVASPLTPRTTAVGNVAGLRFDDPAPVVDAHARTLRARGAAVVIVLAHDGAFCDRDTGCRGEVIDFARKLTEPVDAIVSGHTHSAVRTEVNGIPIVQARSSGQAVAVIDLPVDRAMRGNTKREVRDVVTDSIAADPRIDSLVRAATLAVSELAARPVATVAETMERRGAQYALGNLIADAQRAAAGTDVAVMNNGGIRANLRAGPATYGSLFEIHPFGNMLVRLTVNGRDLRTYVESLVSGDGPRVHVSGMTLRYDPARPSGARAVAVLVGGRPLDDASRYTLALVDFLAASGNGLALATVALRQEPLDISDIDALIAFLRAQPGGIVRADSSPRLIPSTP